MWEIYYNTFHLFIIEVSKITSPDLKKLFCVIILFYYRVKYMHNIKNWDST